jgi:hypothetical protein
MLLLQETWALQWLVRRLAQAPKPSHGQRPSNRSFPRRTHPPRKQPQPRDRHHQITEPNGMSPEAQEIMDLQRINDLGHHLQETVIVVKGGKGHLDAVSELRRRLLGKGRGRGRWLLCHLAGLRERETMKRALRCLLSSRGSWDSFQHPMPLMASQFLRLHSPSKSSHTGNLGPVFRTDDLMMLFRNAVIPSTSGGIKPRSPPSPGPLRGGKLL